MRGYLIHWHLPACGFSLQGRGQVLTGTIITGASPDD